MKIIKILKKYKIFLLIIFFYTNIFAHKNSVEDFRVAAFSDLQFIHNEICENHPGVYDSQNPHFLDDQIDAYCNAKRRIKKAHSMDEAREALIQYTKSFHDSHLKIVYPVQKKSSLIEESAKKDSLIWYKTDEPNIYWFHIGTFEPSEKEKVELDKIITLLPTLQNNNIIIFDVCNNGGGNSKYGSDAMDAFFGKNYAQKKRFELTKNMYTEWRASEDNVRHIEKFEKECVKQFGICDEVTLWIKNIAQGMRSAFKNKKLFYCEDSSLEFKDKKEISKPHITSKIFVLINKGCRSACLDFIDELKMIDYPITFIGKKTGADSVYMEQRTVDLPSGDGVFKFPIKVIRNRKRGNNESHVPDIVYEGDMSNIDIKEFLKD